MSKWEAIRTGFGEDYCAWTVREGPRQMCSTATLRPPDLGIEDWLTGEPKELQARMELVAAAVNAAKEINAENPKAAVEALVELWRLLNDALPIIEAEADRRDDAFFGQIEPYWSEMRELKDQIERVIRKATKKE
jgi:glutathionylspermidine synthase